MSDARPPRWLLALVAAAAGPLADEVEGDLHEWTARWAENSGPRRARFRAVAVGLRMLPGLFLQNLRRNGRPRLVSSLDLRLALRLLVRHPGLSVVSILALAATMAMATTAWTVASQAVWGTVDVPDADRLFVTRMIEPGNPGGAYPSVAEVDRMRSARSVESLSVFSLLGLNVSVDGGLPQRVDGSRVDGAAFQLAGARPALGRLIDAEDIRLERDVVVVSHRLWRTRFGGDPAIVGTTVEVDGRDHEIIGVAPEGFHFPVNQDAWAPLVIPASPDPTAILPGARLMGRHRPEVSRADVDVEFSTLIADVAAPDRDVRPETVPFTRGFMSRGADVVFLAMVLALVGLVTVAAANIANLVLARTEARTEELAVRTALGASRGRIVGQLFTEVLALTGIAAALGLSGAVWALRWIGSLITELPYWIHLDLGIPVLVFSVLLALGAALVAGAYPAFRATGAGLSDGLRRNRRPGFGRISGAVIVTELAVTVGLLAGSTAMGRALLGYQAADFGLPEDEVLTASIAFPIPPAEDGAEPAGALEAEGERLRVSVRESLARVPGVRTVGFSTSLPGEGGRPGGRIQVAGSDELYESMSFAADPEFYDALEVRPISGRLLSDEGDVAEGPAEVVVNQPFVDHVLLGRNPIGQQVRWVSDEGAGIWYEIVGLIPDVGVNPGDPVRSAAIHRPLGASNYLRVAIRVEGDPARVAAPLRAAVAGFDPAARVTRVALLSRAGWEARAMLQGLGGGLLLLGLMALLLSSAGLWAVLSFSVSRRTREIGVRVALGATPGGVVASVIPRTAFHVILGLVLGAALAWAALRLTFVLPIAVPESAALHIGLPALVLLASAAVATLRPTLRALRIRPADALRQE